MAAPTSVAVRQFGAFLKAHGFIHRSLSSLTAATTIKVGEHSGRTNLLKLAGGFVVTMPDATGSGNRYRFVVGTALTSGQYRFTLATSNTLLGGVIIGDSGDTSAALADLYVAAAADNQLDMTLASGGGSIGDWVEFEDIAADKWLVNGVFRNVTDPATPFSTV